MPVGFTSESSVGFNGIRKKHPRFKKLEVRQGVEAAAEVKPALTNKEAFNKNEIICLVCGKRGFKTLARHLNTSHGMKLSAYKKQFDIDSNQHSPQRSTLNRDGRWLWIWDPQKSCQGQRDSYGENRSQTGTPSKITKAKATKGGSFHNCRSSRTGCQQEGQRCKVLPVVKTEKRGV
jgi:hypothetical protein